MPTLQHIDLRNDPAASPYVKDEIVEVIFAERSGELASPEGPNRYARGDAIVSAKTGGRWCVSRDRFDAKYDAIAPLAHGEPGAYRNKPMPVLARQMHAPFSIARSQGGDVLHGAAGDWLLQYAPGDYGIVVRARFEQVYRPLPR